MPDDREFIVQLLRGIQASIVDVRESIAGLDQRLATVEQRMANLERRQSASTHFEQSVLAHLASIHDSMDNFRAELSGMDARIKKLEAH